jgi:Overcoming lysogenization defect protein-like, TOPRIM domain
VTIPPGGPEATERALRRARGARAVVLVEGLSDQLALETLARRRGRDLEGEGVAVVPMGGAQAIARFLNRFSGVRVAALCDAAEENVYRRAFEAAAPAGARFHVCVEDLEDELIRALGVARVQQALDSFGDLSAFRTFQKQPDWRGRPVDRQLRGFLSSADRRKLRYASGLVEAMELPDVPAPLVAALEHVGPDGL